MSSAALTVRRCDDALCGTEPGQNIGMQQWCIGEIIEELLLDELARQRCGTRASRGIRSEEHTSELQSHRDLHSFPTRRSSDLPEHRHAAVVYWRNHRGIVVG